MKVNKVLLFFAMLAIQSIIFSDEMRKAPDFSLVSGKKEIISLSDYNGKMILCFYENRETENDNINLTNKFAENYKKNGSVLNEYISVLAVADCTSANFIVKKIWEEALIKKSIEKGHTVYGDWDGKMKNDYKFSNKACNFIVIDKNKFIRYQSYGAISFDEIEKVEKLIEAILREK